MARPNPPVPPDSTVRSRGAGRQRVVLADVAARAEVSIAAASAALSHRETSSIRVSDKTRQRVRDLAIEMGYIPNPIARALATGRTGILSVFTFESVFPVDAEDFYFPFLAGIETEAEARGQDLLLVSGSRPAAGDRRRVFDGEYNRLIPGDGAVLLGHADMAELERLLELGYPFVFVGKRSSSSDEISYVAIDYAGATRELLEYLWDQGHRMIAYLGAADRDEPNLDRELGIMQFYSEHPTAQTSGWNVDAADFGADRLRRLAEDGFTAIVCDDDALAARVLTAAAGLGMDVPGQLSVAVLGDPMVAGQAIPDCTRFTIPRIEVGAAAVRLLLQLIELDGMTVSPLRTLVPCSFEPGKTSISPIHRHT